MITERLLVATLAVLVPIIAAGLLTIIVLEFQ